MDLTPHQQYRKDAAERRRKIVRLVKKGMKQATIAREVGLTRERVRQIINEESEREARRRSRAVQDEAAQTTEAIVGGSA